MLGSQKPQKQKVRIEVSAAVRSWLAERGFDPKFGARPLGRLIENEIARALADEILFGRLSKGGAVSVDLKDGALMFAYAETATPASVAVA